MSVVFVKESAGLIRSAFLVRRNEDTVLVCCWERHLGQMELLRRDSERIVRGKSVRASMAVCDVLSIDGHVRMLQMNLGFLHQSFTRSRTGLFDVGDIKQVCMLV